MTRVDEDLALLRRLNPIPETADSRWSLTEEGRRLFAELEAQASGLAASAPRRQRPRWRRPTVAIPVFVALSASALLFASAVAESGTIVVDAREATRNPHAVEQQLERAGIEADVRLVPAHDSLIGKWAHAYLEPGTPADSQAWADMHAQVGQSHSALSNRCDLDEEFCDRTNSLELSLDLKGPLTLVAGRAPTGAEAVDSYWYADDVGGENELSPNGALYCFRLEERTPAEADRLLRQAGYDVVWVYEGDSYSDEAAGPPAEGLITWAWFREPQVVDVRVSDDEHRADDIRMAEGTPSRAHPRPTAPWAPRCG